MKDKISIITEALLNSTMTKDDADKALLELLNDKPIKKYWLGEDHPVYLMDPCPFKKIPMCSNPLSFNGCGNCRVTGQH